jgi:hypothetical protein
MGSESERKSLMQMHLRKHGTTLAFPASEGLLSFNCQKT